MFMYYGVLYATREEAQRAASMHRLGHGNPVAKLGLTAVRNAAHINRKAAAKRGHVKHKGNEVNS